MITDNALIPTPTAALSADVQPLSWQQIAHDWLSNFTSTRTRQTYAESWQTFLRYMGEQHGISEPWAISPSHVLAYREHLRITPGVRTGRPAAKTTINLRLSAISSFFEYARSRGLTTANPAEGGKHGIKRESVSPYGKASWLDVEAGDDLALLKSIDRSTTQGKRDFALLLLFLTTAVRAHVITELRCSSISREGARCYMAYTNKGGDEIKAKLPAETCAALDAYLATRPDRDGDAPLFTASPAAAHRAAASLAQRGISAPQGEQPLSVRAVQYLIKHYCDRHFGAGQHNIHPHSLRHSAAVAAEHEGATLTAISSLLRHKNARVTSVYMHSLSDAGSKVSESLGRRYRIE